MSSRIPDCCVMVTSIVEGKVSRLIERGYAIKNASKMLFERNGINTSIQTLELESIITTTSSRLANPKQVVLASGPGMEVLLGVTVLLFLSSNVDCFLEAPGT